MNKKSNTSAKGDLFMKQADKKLIASDGLICIAFGQKDSTKEEAAELYMKAGAQYKISKLYNLSGIAYKKGAEIYKSINDSLNAKQAYKDCGKCFSNIDIQQSIIAYSNAIQIELDCDRLSSAAKIQTEIADMLRENNEICDSILAYEKASEYYEIEHNKLRQNKILLKVAHLYGEIKIWKKASNLFENIAKDSVDNKLLKWCVKEYLFKASLLKICEIGDDNTIERGEKWTKMEIINEEYCDLSNIYCDSREYKLIINIVAALKQNNINQFQDLISKYDTICCLDKWKVHILHYILDCMKQTENDQVLESIIGVDDIYNDNNDEEFSTNEQTNPFDQQLNPTELEKAPRLDMED